MKILHPSVRSFLVVFFLRAFGAERCGSGAANSGSDVGADAVRRRLQPVVRCFGGYAATHLKGTVPAPPWLAILTSTPWVVVTVSALVLCARL
jgi:hypothetical protein